MLTAGAQIKTNDTMISYHKIQVEDCTVFYREAGAKDKPAGANAFRRDVPNAEIHFVPSGHFALESHHTEIAALMREFLSRNIKACKE